MSNGGSGAPLRSLDGQLTTERLGARLQGEAQVFVDVGLAPFKHRRDVQRFTTGEMVAHQVAVYAFDEGFYCQIAFGKFDAAVPGPRNRSHPLWFPRRGLGTRKRLHWISNKSTQNGCQSTDWGMFFYLPVDILAYMITQV